MNEWVEQWQRNQMVLGEEMVQSLAQKRVLIAGLGGVGSYAAEAFARLGVGHLMLVDRDVLEPTNLNRQLYALHSTLGKPKAEVARERILDINPQVDVQIATRFIDDSMREWLNIQEYDFVVDAIDTLRYKASLIQTCAIAQIPMVSSMGMAERVDPTLVRIGSLADTSNDPVSKQMRIYARKNQLDLGSIRVVYSLEKPHKSMRDIQENMNEKKEKSPLGSIILVPATAGLYCAYEALRQWLVK